VEQIVLPLLHFGDAARGKPRKSTASSLKSLFERAGGMPSSLFVVTWYLAFRVILRMEARRVIAGETTLSEQDLEAVTVMEFGFLNKQTATVAAGSAGPLLYSCEPP
jgi:hypothetical protein